MRQSNTDFVAGTLQLAADLGAPTVITGAGSKDVYGYEKWFFEWAFESLRQLLPIADRLSITLAIEASSPPGCLVHNTETLHALLSVEGLDSLDFLFDYAHFHIRRENPVNAFENFSNQFVHMHAKDAVGGPENIIFPPLGQGQIDFDAFLEIMAAADYDGYIAVEYEACRWDFSIGYQQVLPQEKEFIQHLVAQHWKKPNSRG